MTDTALANNGEQQVARPLRVLVPLIKEDLENGRQAAERAGMPYYQAAGEKLIEAKGQMKHGEFMPWVQRHFGIGHKSATIYMKLAESTTGQIGSAIPFSSLGDFIRKTGPDTDYNLYAAKKAAGMPSWQEPVRQVISRVDTETLNLKREQLKKQEEREAERKLGLQLIDIGYKVLAQTLHPDKKTGSREAMARLNAVRERLKLSA